LKEERKRPPNPRRERGEGKGKSGAGKKTLFQSYRAGGEEKGRLIHFFYRKRGDEKRV